VNLFKALPGSSAFGPPGDIEPFKMALCRMNSEVGKPRTEGTEWLNTYYKVCGRYSFEKRMALAWSRSGSGSEENGT
jgi:hypothetical protein